MLYLNCITARINILEFKPGIMKPISKQVRAGKKVTFTCTSESPVTWYYNNTVFKIKWNSYITKKNKYSLIISSAQRKNSGEYSCVGTDKDGNLFRSKSSLVVTPRKYEH